jgi:AcrR family transcriptional regulator
VPEKDLATVENARVKKPRLTGNERRGQIIQAATRLFSRYGFRGATMRELASKVVDGPLQEFFQLFGSRLERSMENGTCREMNGPLTARLLCGMAYYAMLLREIYKDPGMQEIAMEDLKSAIVDLFYGAIRIRKPDRDACDE